MFLKEIHDIFFLSIRFEMLGLYSTPEFCSLRD